MQTYAITGMTCDHCVRAVAKALARVPGVKKVQKVVVGEAQLEGAPEEQAVLAALRDEGYEARRAG